MKGIYLVVLLVLLCVFACEAWGQTEASGAPKFGTPPVVSEGKATNVLTRWSATANDMLPIIAIAFGVVALVSISILGRHKAISPADTPRYIVLTLIVVGTLVFVCAGFEDKEITSAMGLFGSIAGYMLGRVGSEATQAKEAEKGATDAPQG